MKRIIIFVTAAVICILALTALDTIVNADEPCQYPTRPLVAGQCDNSDPCDPTTIKDPVLHGDCAPVDNDTYPTEPPTPVSSTEQAPVYYDEPSNQIESGK